MNNNVWLGLAALSAVTALPASAQDRPLLRPVHDVAVTYRVEATGPQGQQVERSIRMYWTGQGSRMRLEVEGQSGFALVDFAADRTTLVIPAQHAYAEVPFDPARAPGLDIPPGVSMTKGPVDTVAGTPCTEWSMRGPQGGGSACIPGDGLLLRVSGEKSKRPNALEAVLVAYGPQPAALFTVPAGLTRIAPR
jgi:hypothetical protein